ncbi:hypothetical protein ACA910_009691 [Epithemia clementina (nom. ined.)]
MTANLSSSNSKHGLDDFGRRRKDSGDGVVGYVDDEGLKVRVDEEGSPRITDSARAQREEDTNSNSDDKQHDLDHSHGRGRKDDQDYERRYERRENGRQRRGGGGEAAPARTHHSRNQGLRTDNRAEHDSHDVVTANVNRDKNSDNDGNNKQVFEQVGAIVQGRIARIEPYGAFLEWEQSSGSDEQDPHGNRHRPRRQRGLIHISELSPDGSRVENVESMVHVGDEIYARIVRIVDPGTTLGDSDDNDDGRGRRSNNNNNQHHRKINLSLRGLNPRTGEEIEVSIPDERKRPPGRQGGEYRDHGDKYNNNTNNHNNQQYGRGQRPSRNGNNIMRGGAARAQQRAQLMERLARDVSWMQREFPTEVDPSILRLLFSESPERSNASTTPTSNTKTSLISKKHAEDENATIPKESKQGQRRRRRGHDEDSTASENDSSSNSSSDSSEGDSSSSDSSSEDRRSKRKGRSSRRDKSRRSSGRKTKSRPTNKRRKTSEGRRRRRRYSSSSSSYSSSSEDSSSSSSGTSEQNGNDRNNDSDSKPRHSDTKLSPRAPVHHDIDQTSRAGTNDQLPTTASAFASKENADSDDDDSVGPRPPGADGHGDTADGSGMHAAGGRGGHYGKALLPGEGQAMATYVQQNLRVPRRGEIGYDADEIERYENSGYVMSGSRHARMNAVRIRKENQVYSAEEQRALALITLQENQRKEAELLQDWKEMLEEKKKQKQQQSTAQDPPHDNNH